VLTTAEVCEWAGYVADDFKFNAFPSGARVLDVGFGRGEQMRALAASGCRSVGIDVSPELVSGARKGGWCVCRAAAEHLPFLDGAFDGLICKVVIPYTIEATVISEIGRVLRKGGIARVSYHGLGYSLRYLLTDRNWKRRVYGARVVVNTWLYSITGSRLPGFLGDTLYQSERRLRSYYKHAGLELVGAHPSARFFGACVFIYHTLRKI